VPWSIQKRDGKFCVIKDDDDENEGCHDTEEQAKKQMAALYASENRTERRAPIETREAKLSDVDVEQRIIEVVAVPYGGEAMVEYRGEIWRESFERGAFAGIETRSKPIKAIRDHDKARLVGRTVSFSPERQEGLVSSIKIAKTNLGDETLTLAKEDMLDVSSGFAVPGSGQVLNPTQGTRRIRKAFLDHIAFVADGAYEDAKVLSVRRKQERAADMAPLVTPLLDEAIAWREAWQEARRHSP
jgi:HK97 family phage prohead protease